MAHPIRKSIVPAVVYLRGLFDWLDTGKLALAGVIWYGFLWITYNRFYEPLGIMPSDVGLGYANILASSVGAAVAFLIPLGALTLALTFLAIYFRFWGLRSSDFDGDISRFPVDQSLGAAILRRMIMLIGIGALAFLLWAFPVRAGEEAQKVMRGQPVSPLYAFASPAPILAIQAIPVVSVKSTVAKKVGDTVAVETLPSHGLLYMGQANSVIVLYDSVRHQAIYLPATSVLLTLQPRY